MYRLVKIEKTKKERTKESDVLDYERKGCCALYRVEEEGRLYGYLNIRVVPRHSLKHEP